MIALSSTLLCQILLAIPYAAAGLLILTKNKKLRNIILILLPSAGCVVAAALYSQYINVETYDPVYFAWGALLPGLEISFSLEPIGMLFLCMVVFLWLVAMLYGIGYAKATRLKHSQSFFVLFCLAIGNTIGVALSDNLLTLFLFYELLTLCTYPLVAHERTDRAKQGARVYLGYLLATSIVFFLPAIVWLWSITGSLTFTAGGLLQHTSLSRTALLGLYLLFVFGIAKTAIMPLHRWLPAAMVAPVPVSALLHAVAVVKTGVFVLLKVSLYIFGSELLRQQNLGTWLVYLAGITIVLASIWALREDDLKRRLAYSTINQLAYIVLGAALATTTGVIGAVMHILMHAFAKITLFFCAGIIYIGSGVSWVSKLSAPGRTLPWVMTLFLLASLSICGLPPFGGMWSKIYLLRGIIEAGHWPILLAMLLSTVLSIVYLVLIPVRAFLSAPNGHDKAKLRHIPLSCLIATSISGIGCVLLFFAAQPIFVMLTNRLPL